MMKGIRHKLVFKYDKLDPCITVRLASRQRLVIFVAGGRMYSMGHGEPGLIGRAASWKHATPIIQEIFTLFMTIPQTADGPLA